MKNKDNWAFYNAIPKGETIRSFERASGLERAPELDILRVYWEKSSSILEVGAGDGRVIEGLLDRGYSGLIRALERDTNFIKELRRKYGKNNKIDIIEGDILNPPKISVSDCGLWLWSGIAEFSPSEQIKAVEILSKFVRGKLIIDLPFLEETNANVKEGKFQKIVKGWGALEGYLPDKLEISNCARQSKFKSLADVQYNTKSDRKRVIYILQK